MAIKYNVHHGGTVSFFSILRNPVPIAKYHSACIISFAKLFFARVFGSVDPPCKFYEYRIFHISIPFTRAQGTTLSLVNYINLNAPLAWLLPVCPRVGHFWNTFKGIPPLGKRNLTTASLLLLEQSNTIITPCQLAFLLGELRIRFALETRNWYDG